MLCQRSDEIPSTFFHVKLARIEYIPSKEKHSALLDLQFLECVDCEWNANLHLKILTLVRALKGFRQELKQRKDKDTESNVREKKGRAIDWAVTFKSETNLLLLLSEENTMIFGTGK